MACNADTDAPALGAIDMNERRKFCSKFFNSTDESAGDLQVSKVEDKMRDTTRTL